MTTTETTYYRIWNAASGADLGAFPGDTEEDAIRAMLSDAGCDDEPSEDLRVEETEPNCAACGIDQTDAGEGLAGTCEGLYTDLVLCSDCASYTLDELGIDEDASEVETQDEYLAKVAADRLNKAAVVAYLRDIAESAGGAVDAWADEGLSETDAEELGLSGPMLAAADALTRRWAQRIISERPEATR